MTDPMPPMPDQGASKFITRAEREQRVQALLEYRGWSFYRWAQIMGVKPNQATRYLESDDPRISTIIRMAAALGCSAGYLLDRNFRRA